MKYCCSEFEKMANESVALSAHTFEYVDGIWYITGCCGHCYVVERMEYCPFCGSHLTKHAPDVGNGAAQQGMFD